MITFKIHGKPAVQVASIEDAQRKWCKYREACMYASGGGASEIGNGGIVREDGKIIARVSYNGRLWDASGKNEYRPAALQAA